MTDKPTIFFYSSKTFIKFVIFQPYENCDRYQQEVKGGQALEDEMNDYYSTAEFATVCIKMFERVAF